MVKHLKVCKRDILAKLQAMQKCDNKALQINLQEPLLLHFIRRQSAFFNNMGRKN